MAHINLFLIRTKMKKKINNSVQLRRDQRWQNVGQWPKSRGISKLQT